MTTVTAERKAVVDARKTPDKLAQLLDDIQAALKRWLVVGDSQFITLALYVVHTHAFELSGDDAVGQYPYHSPYLRITSAVKRCGKTRMLEALSFLVGRPWLCSLTTTAALVRRIQNDQPTLLLDETDRAFGGDKDYQAKLTGILNAGYTRRGSVWMCEGQGSNQQAKEWRVFCPKVFSGIGDQHLPDTLIDRSIPIAMKRKVNERVEKFHELEAMRQLRPITQRCEDLAPQLISTLKDARPTPAPDLNDRAEDIWTPLLAIADLAGDRWPELARQAATELSGEANHPDADISVLLLRDINALWPADEPFLPSQDLLRQLNELEEELWPTWSRGNPMTPHALARLLQEFQIKSKSNGHVRGYQRDDFQDAFTRHNILKKEVN
jgi:hypothetical protein